MRTLLGPLRVVDTMALLSSVILVLVPAAASADVVGPTETAVSIWPFAAWVVAVGVALVLLVRSVRGDEEE